MRSEGGPGNSADPDAAHAPQRPASNLLLVGTVLSLALAVIALIGFSPPARSPPSPLDTSQIRTVPVAVDDLRPLAIDRTRPGGITIQEMALSSSSPWSSWTAPEPFGAARFGSPRALGPNTAAGPPRPAVSIAPANLENPIALGNPTGRDSPRVWTGALDTSTFVDGRTTPGDVDTGDISHDSALVGVLAGRNAGNSGLLGASAASWAHSGNGWLVVGAGALAGRNAGNRGLLGAGVGSGNNSGTRNLLGASARSGA